jgi:hypothetical protein
LSDQSKQRTGKEVWHETVDKTDSVTLLDRDMAEKTSGAWQLGFENYPA